MSVVPPRHMRHSCRISKNTIIVMVVAFPPPLSLSALFGSADIFALEDVDIFLSGRENTQNTFAQIIVEAAHEGKKIYLTGIELQARAHHFIETVKRYCPNLKIHTSVKRSI